MNTISAKRFALVGASLIALGYGLSRFAFGLFVPGIRADMGLSPTIMGMVASQAYLGFVAISFFAPALTRRLGSRGAACLSGLFLVAGLSLIGFTDQVVVLGLGVFAGGLGTGLMMPALSAGVDATIALAKQPRVNATMNAGTSFGIALAVPAVWLATDAWRAAYLTFAALALLITLLCRLQLPNVSDSQSKPSQAPPTLPKAPLAALGAIAFLMGVVSSIYWVFAPDWVLTAGALTPTDTGTLWITVGLAGLLGAVAGDLGWRFGFVLSQSVFLLILSSALLLIAWAPTSYEAAVLSAALFGCAYMMLSGVYLVWGIRLLPGRASKGAVWAFLCTTLGQALGSQLAGVAVDGIGYAPGFTAYASLGVVVALASWRFSPTTQPPTQ